LSPTRCGYELVAITNNPAEMHIWVCIFQTVKFDGLKKCKLGLKTQAGLSKMNVPLMSTLYNSSIFLNKLIKYKLSSERTAF
jgi:hypothetical protein